MIFLKIERVYNYATSLLGSVLFHSPEAPREGRRSGPENEVDNQLDIGEIQTHYTCIQFEFPKARYNDNNVFLSKYFGKTLSVANKKTANLRFRFNHDTLNDLSQSH